MILILSFFIRIATKIYVIKTKNVIMIKTQTQMNKETERKNSILSRTQYNENEITQHLNK